MDKTLINELGDELYQAMVQRETVTPLTSRGFDISVEDAYHISLRMLERRLADGASIIGKKIGVTSKAVQNMLNVHQPDFGYLTDDMVFNSGEIMPISDRLIAPRAEGEIAFILKKDLIGPGITNADVLAATECVMPCFEIVDSRIQDWKIAIQDTVADNASCGLFVLGDQAVSPRKVDLVTCGMVVEKNGSVLSAGAGAAALGSPVNCVTWLANTLAERGKSLQKDMIVMTGSIVSTKFLNQGDEVEFEIDTLGGVRLTVG